jgi:hypothetical protein
MKIDLVPAIDAWKIAEVEERDAYMALRIAFMKYIEGIGGPPAEMLLQRAMSTRLGSLASMQAVIHSMTSHPPDRMSAFGQKETSWRRRR